MSALKKFIGNLSKKCNTTDDDATVEVCDISTGSKNLTNSYDNDHSHTTIIEVDATTDSLKPNSTSSRKRHNHNTRQSNSNKKDKKNSIQALDGTIDNNSNVVETNMDTLTNQVLNLPREFRPICLVQDTAISSKPNGNVKHNSTNVDSTNNQLNDDQVPTQPIDVPTLPPLRTDIYINNTNEETSVIDEDVTLSMSDMVEDNDLSRKRI